MNDLNIKKTYERAHVSIVQSLAFSSSQIRFKMLRNDTTYRSVCNPSSKIFCYLYRIHV